MASNSPILLLIDIQQALVEGPAEWGPRSNAKFTENVAHLLKTWRARGWPVLHVYHDELSEDEPDSPLQSKKFPEAFAPHACAAPLPSELQFIKHVGSPLVATGLGAELDRLEKDGKRKIVVIGMDASQCINNTTRHGGDLGYQMVVVGDACAGYGMQDWKTGKPVGADETLDAAMGVLTGMVPVTTVEKVLGVLGQE